MRFKYRILLITSIIIVINILLFMFFIHFLFETEQLKDISHDSIKTLYSWNDYQLSSNQLLLATSNYIKAGESVKEKHAIFKTHFLELINKCRHLNLDSEGRRLIDSLERLWIYIDEILIDIEDYFVVFMNDEMQGDLIPYSISSSLTNQNLPVEIRLQILRYIERTKNAELSNNQFKELLTELTNLIEKDIDNNTQERLLILIIIFISTNIITFILSYIFAKRGEKVEYEKEKMRNQLMHIQKMEALGTFTGGIAHDFNNLLTVIVGYSSSLLDDLDPESEEYQEINEIYKTSNRATELTRQLLTLSKQQIIHPELLNINNVINEINNLLIRIINKNVQMKTELSQYDIPIFADKGQIEQIIVNLTINARDAMEKGGTLKIKTEIVEITDKSAKTIPHAHKGEFCCITFEDTGTGIPKEIINKIFDPFFTTKASKQGTGLGLSVVYGIVEKHNGWINVYSEVDFGSTFKIYFPVTRDKMAPRETDTKSKADKKLLKGNYEKILIVEDDEVVREFASEILRKNDYIVTEAEGVESAFSICESTGNNLDLLFCDIMLPDGKGTELVSRIIKIYPDIKIILTSGYSEINMQDISDFDVEYPLLHKPYSIKKLLKFIHDTLNKS